MKIRLAGVLLMSAACVSCQQVDQTGSDGAEPSKGDRGAEKADRNGPFGIDFGQPLKDLKLEPAVEGEDPSIRALIDVPKPVSEIEFVAVRGFPETGVCEIRGVSRTFDSDAYGVQVKSAMATLADSLDSKYRKHRKTDQCGSYNCKFFQMNLKDGSQVHLYQWNKESGAKLPDGMDEIAMGANAAEFNDTYFRLDYRSTDLKRCAAAANKAKASSL